MAGGIYHVINRGNYRRDLFVTPGEGQAFLETLREAKDLMGWRVHAYVLMRNHYHIALETPEPNLVEGMHWLQSTWSTRFNRFRQERGHLFQGRYQALLVEDGAGLARVVDYIHLNPVRAKIVLPAQLAAYRWSSLAGIVKATGWTDDRGWRGIDRFGPDAEGRKAYAAYLVEVGEDEASWERLGLKGLAEGWAIGTSGWRQALAKAHGHRSLSHGMAAAEVRELREGAWEAALSGALMRAGRAETELATKPRRAAWKLAVAQQVRNETGAPIAWLARRMLLGTPATLRSYLCRARQAENQQTTA